jgi:addiction module RelB/DinJ family antitoxin
MLANSKTFAYNQKIKKLGGIVMQRTSSVFARVEPEIKEQAEQVLHLLGIPMSNAIGLFLRQIIIHRGIPFDMKLPAQKPVAIGAMNAAELNAVLEKGYDDVVSGKLYDLDEIVADMQRDYGV